MSAATIEPASFARSGATQGVPLLIGSTFPVMGLLMIAPVLPQIIADFAASTPGADIIAPIALTVPALFIAICGPLFGPVIDRVGRLRVLYPALVAYAVIGSLPFLLDSLWAIFVARALLGVTEAAIMSCCLTLIGDYFQGQRRDRWLSMHAAAASIGAVVFLAVGGALGTLGWRVPFLVYLLPIPLLVWLAVVLREPRVNGDRRIAELSASERPRLPWSAITAPLVITLLSSVLFYVMQVELSVVLATFGADSGAIGVAAALANAGVVVGSIVFTVLARRMRTVVLIAAGILLSSIGLIPIGLGGGVESVTVGAVINGLGDGLILPGLLVVTTSRLVFADRGRGTAAWASMFQLGEFLSPVIVAAVASVVGGLGSAIAWIGGAGLVIVVLAVVLLRNVTTNEQEAAAVGATDAAAVT